MTSFAESEKQQQIRWAIDHGLGAALEIRRGRQSWVLATEHAHRNVFRESWWRLIEGKQHLWARALNSSQAFAVNLFGPLVDRPDAAVDVVRALLHERVVPDGTQALVHLEYTPPGAATWLGEGGGQPTQVDAWFETAVTRDATGDRVQSTDRSHMPSSTYTQKPVDLTNEVLLHNELGVVGLGGISLARVMQRDRENPARALALCDLLRQLAEDWPDAELAAALEVYVWAECSALNPRAVLVSEAIKRLLGRTEKK